MGGCSGRTCPCSLFQMCRSCAIAPSLNPSNFASPISHCTMDSQLYKAMHWDCGSICSCPPSLTKAPECQWFAIYLCTSIKRNIDIHKRTRGKFIFVGCLFCCSRTAFSALDAVMMDCCVHLPLLLNVSFANRCDNVTIACSEFSSWWCYIRGII